MRLLQNKLGTFGRTVLSNYWHLTFLESATCRHCSSVSSKSSSSITVKTISKQLHLRSVTTNDKNKKHLVLMYEWLFATPQAVNKYCDLYHQQGHDVMVIKGSLLDFIWPPTGYKMSEQILNHLGKERNQEETYIVHAFSVGAYIYSLNLMLTKRQPEKFGFFRENIRGQVFDSIVLGSYHHMSTGIALALPGTKAVKSPILWLMNNYYEMTKKTTKEEYDKLVDMIKEEPLSVPTLVFFSHDDPMCDVPTMNKMLDDWLTNGYDVTSVSWPKSVHAAHLKYHPKDYNNAFLQYLANT